MRASRFVVSVVAVVSAAALSAAACGSDATTGATTTTIATTTTVPVTSIATTTFTTTSSTTTTAPSGLEQPAIWPARDVVFTDPEQAASDFVIKVLSKEPVLGAFQQGDSRSGEIEVFSPGDGEGAAPVSRGVLLLRQLGPRDGWFVIAAANDSASITEPAASATVASGPVTVKGIGRGFEATVVVSAFVAGVTGALDSEVAQAGAFETAEPFTVTLDLSGASPGQTVMILVRGAAGLETDPGEFGAIPVTIG